MCIAKMAWEELLWENQFLTTAAHISQGRWCRGRRMEIHGYQRWTGLQEVYIFDRPWGR